MYNVFEGGAMDKKLLIKNTATKLFKETGQVTVREIANECHVNVASINYYFGSKSNLMAEIEEQMILDIHTFVNAIEEKSGSPEEAVELFIDVFYNFIMDAPGFFKYLIKEFSSNEVGQLLTLRKEINTGRLNEFLLKLIKEHTGLEDEVELGNRLAIFFTALAVSAITSKAIRSEYHKDAVLMNLLSTESNYKSYLRTLFDLILKK